MSGFIQINISVGTKEEGQKLVHSLVKNRLIACGQILGPMQSTYWWKGKIETAQEWICFAKSKEEKFNEILQQPISDKNFKSIPGGNQNGCLNGIGCIVNIVEPEDKHESYQGSNSDSRPGTRSKKYYKRQADPNRRPDR